MLRDIGAFVVGMMVGMMANSGVLEISNAMHPMPEGLDPSDWDAMTAYIETLPTSGFLMAMLAHLSQAFFGGAVGAAISQDRPVPVALAVGGFSMIGGIMMMTMVKHPTWMYIELPLYWACAWAAAQLVLAMRQRSA